MHKQFFCLQCSTNRYFKDIKHFAESSFVDKYSIWDMNKSKTNREGGVEINNRDLQLAVTFDSEWCNLVPQGKVYAMLHCARETVETTSIDKRIIIFCDSQPQLRLFFIYKFKLWSTYPTIEILSEGISYIVVSEDYW